MPAAPLADQVLEQGTDGAELPLKTAPGQAAGVAAGDVAAQQGVVDLVPVVDLLLFEKAAAAEQVAPVGLQRMGGKLALVAQVVGELLHRAVQRSAEGHRDAGSLSVAGRWRSSTRARASAM